MLILSTLQIAFSLFHSSLNQFILKFISDYVNFSLFQELEFLQTR